MVKEVVLILICFFFTGCAGAIVHTQSGVITSEPPGAYVTAYNSGAGANPYNRDRNCGYTPCKLEMKAAALTNWAIKIKKDGYLDREWKVPRELSDISHHFVLEKDPFLLLVERAKTEMALDPKDYLKDIPFLKLLNRLLAECEKVLKSPRMNAGIYATEAKALYQELRLDFPPYESTYLIKYVALLVTECDKVIKNETAESVVNITFLLNEIRGTTGL